MNDIHKQLEACENRIQAVLDKLARDIDAANEVFSKKPGLKKKLHADKASQNDLVYLGMGDGAGYETKKLKGMTREGVTDIRQQGAEGDTTVLTAKGLVDVGSREGVKKFLDGMKLDDTQKKKLAKTLEGIQETARDEAAQFIQILQQAEEGEREMERVVLSGHSSGEAIWGDHNGTLTFSAMAKIAQQFPEAAAQVEDLMLSACNSGGEADLGQYKKIFPKLKTIWGYADSAPGAHSGAVTHMKIWERASRGKGTKTMDPDRAKRTRKGKNVVSWSEEEGYQGKKHRDIEEVLDDLEDQEGLFQSYYKGNKEVASTSSGEMRSYYNLVNAALFNPALPSGKRAELKKRKSIAIRVLFFKVIRKKFWAAHGKVITEAYQAAGQDLPEFSGLGRGAAIRAAQSLKQAGGEARAVDLLQKGLVELRPKYIPMNWI